MKIGYVIAAIGGAAAGFLVGYLFKEKKDEEYIHREIAKGRKQFDESTRKVVELFEEAEERMQKREAEVEKMVDIPEDRDYVEPAPPPEGARFTDKESVNDYLNRIHDNEYDDPAVGNGSDHRDDEYRNSMGETKAEEMERRVNAKPYRMSSQNFGQIPEHELVGFTLYTDGILTDDNNERIYDSTDMTGMTIGDLMDLMNVIPDGEEKVLYFRNEKYQLDIEIIDAEETYAESLGEGGQGVNE